jgi:hypothetical protein
MHCRATSPERTQKPREMISVPIPQSPPTSLIPLCPATFNYSPQKEEEVASGPWTPTPTKCCMEARHYVFMDRHHQPRLVWYMSTFFCRRDYHSIAGNSLFNRQNLARRLSHKYWLENQEHVFSKQIEMLSEILEWFVLGWDHEGSIYYEGVVANSQTFLWEIIISWEWHKYCKTLSCLPWFVQRPTSTRTNAFLRFPAPSSSEAPPWDELNEMRETNIRNPSHK